MKKARFLLRALVFFVIFLAIGAGVLRFSTHHYKNIARWGETDSMENLIYEDEIYHLAGEIGDPGLGTKTFPKDEVLGEVKPDGILDRTPPYVVWSVKEKEDFLIIVVDDDTQLLYYHSDVSNPAETTETSAS